MNGSVPAIPQTVSGVAVANYTLDVQDCGLNTGKWAITYSSGPTNYTLNIVNQHISASLPATYFALGNQIVQNSGIILPASSLYQLALEGYSRSLLSTLTNDQIVGEIVCLPLCY